MANSGITIAVAVAAGCRAISSDATTCACVAPYQPVSGSLRSVTCNRVHPSRSVPAAARLASRSRWSNAERDHVRRSGRGSRARSAASGDRTESARPHAGSRTRPSSAASARPGRRDRCAIRTPCRSGFRAGSVSSTSGTQSVAVAPAPRRRGTRAAGRRPPRPAGASQVLPAQAHVDGRLEGRGVLAEQLEARRRSRPP